MEIWRDIVGYEGLYQISSYGNVRNKIGLIMKQRKDKDGYSRISLYKHCNGKKILKTIFIHRLVAEAFLKNEKGYECVNHKDENKNNNCIDNLEWCTRAYNNRYSFRKRTNWHHSQKVKNVDTGEVFDSICKAAIKYGVVPGAIYNCCIGRTNTSAGYRWSYM